MNDTVIQATLRSRLRKLFERLPFVRPIAAERDRLRAIVSPLGFLPGHYYSPFPALDEIRAHESSIFGDPPRELPGLDLREAAQLEFYEALVPYYAELPFQPRQVAGLRYFYENDFYPYFDAIILYAMLRHIKPGRIIEIGSGFSSAVILDTNELFLGNSIQAVFIDPNPGRLLTLLRESDRARVHIIAEKFQDVAPTEFAALAGGDLLFIDSTHVSKVDSDVNHLLFDLLPALPPGVYIHFHDIFYPFEYPKHWIYKGWAWNECYILRAFLQYNQRFEIVFFNSFLEQFHRDRFQIDMPLCLKARGSSLWLVTK